MKKYKNNLVPKLRFPEFINSPEWEEKTLGDIFDFSIKPESSLSFDKQKIITVKLHTAGIVKNERTETLTGGTNYYIRKSGQFIFSKIDFLNGAFGIIPLELNGFVSSTDVPAFSFNKNIIPTYFKYWLSENYKKIKIERTGTSNTLKRISIDKFFDINLPVPTLEEQQKIADCLSSLDELITAENEKLKYLKEHKKGLMQKLFPAEGESVPELRFPEFRNSGDWEEKTLGDILIKNSIKNKDLKYTLVQSVSNKYGFINQDEYFDDRRVASKDTSNYYVITKGCFAYNPSRIDVGSLAYKYDDEISIISPLYVSFKSNNKKVIDIFLLNWFSSDVFKNQMIFEGGVRNTLNYDNLSFIKIKFPTLPEQQKIADCLSSLDDLINAQDNKIKKLKEHKKGLMQGLFPSATDMEKVEY